MKRYEYEYSEIPTIRLIDTSGLFEGGMQGMAVDDFRGFVYWAQYKNIKQTSLDGSNKKTLLHTGKLSVICKLITESL